MKFTVTKPRAHTVEEDQLSGQFEASTVEDAVIIASNELLARGPQPGDIWVVTTRVEVMPKSVLPLRSV